MVTKGCDQDDNQRVKNDASWWVHWTHSTCLESFLLEPHVFVTWFRVCFSNLVEYTFSDGDAIPPSKVPKLQVHEETVQRFPHLIICYFISTIIYLDPILIGIVHMGGLLKSMPPILFPLARHRTTNNAHHVNIFVRLCCFTVLCCFVSHLCSIFYVSVASKFVVLDRKISTCLTHTCHTLTCGDVVRAVTFPPSDSCYLSFWPRG